MRIKRMYYIEPEKDIEFIEHIRKYGISNLAKAIGIASPQMSMFLSGVCGLQDDKIQSMRRKLKKFHGNNAVIRVTRLGKSGFRTPPTRTLA